MLPELEHFRRQILALPGHPLLHDVIDGGDVRLSTLSAERIAELLRNEAAYYLLIAAAGLNRTSLKRAAAEPELAIVAPRMRKAVAIQRRLPVREPLGEISSRALALRQADMSRSLRARIRTQIVQSPPAVVALLLCSRDEAHRYRSGVETFVDRIFFQEEIEECLAYLRQVTTEP